MATRGRSAGRSRSYVYLAPHPFGRRGRVEGGPAFPCRAVARRGSASRRRQAGRVRLAGAVRRLAQCRRLPVVWTGTVSQEVERRFRQGRPGRAPFRRKGTKMLSAWGNLQDFPRRGQAFFMGDFGGWTCKGLDFIFGGPPERSASPSYFFRPRRAAPTPSIRSAAGTIAAGTTTRRPRTSATIGTIPARSGRTGSFGTAITSASSGCRGSGSAGNGTHGRGRPISRGFCPGRTGPSRTSTSRAGPWGRLPTRSPTTTAPTASSTASAGAAPRGRSTSTWTGASRTGTGT